MTTTSSTTSTASIVSTLGSGSGIDINALVANLVTAQFQTKSANLQTKSDKVDTQISDVAKLQSTITGFSSALQSLISGGTLATAPVSSNTGLLNVTALPGAKLANLSTSVTVKQLATAQAATTTAMGLTKTSVIGTGTLNLSFGTAAYDTDGTITSFVQGAAATVQITIDDSHKTLQGVADAINAANKGVTATVVSDVNGARITLKSATGASQAFNISADEGTTPGLSALNVGVGETATAIGTKAQDANLIIDGVTLRRASNTITDLVPGVKMVLSAASDTPVALTAQRPTSALSQAVSDFVETYNEVYAIGKADINATTGSLSRDSAAQSVQRGLSALTLKQVVTSTNAAAPKTLAEIGVGTNRDGTLKVNTAQLTTALSTYPDEVEAMFASSGGLVTALTALSTAATDTKTGLTASTTNYTKQKSDIADQQDKVSTDSDAMKTRLTSQFAKMDSVVAAYKSTQSYLTNQIAAWNKSS